MEDPTPVSPFHQELAALHHRVADLEAALTVQQHDAQALRDAQEYAEKIVETIRDPLLVLTADLRVRVANPAFYHTFQVRPAETEGQLIYQLDHGQWDIPALRTLLEELLPQNTVFNDYEVTQTFERIGARTMLLNARRLDAVQLILLAMEDITARKQTERRLQEEIAERQRLERDAQRVAHFALLGRLAGGVSHELRNPLAVIVLHVDLLEEELRQPSPDSATEIALALTEIKSAPRARGRSGRGLSLPRARLDAPADPHGAEPAGDAVCPRNPPGTRRARHHAPTRRCWTSSAWSRSIPTVSGACW